MDATGSMRTVVKIEQKPYSNWSLHQSLLSIAIDKSNFCSWTMICTNDPWINIASLLNYLKGFDFSSPIVIGRLKLKRNRAENFVCTDSDACIVFTRSAVDELLDSWLQNDITESSGFTLNCFKLRKSLCVTSHLFHAEAPSMLPDQNGGFWYNRPDFLREISFNNFLSPDLSFKMTCDAFYFWHVKLPSECRVTRYDPNLHHFRKLVDGTWVCESLPMNMGPENYRLF